MIIARYLSTKILFSTLAVSIVLTMVVMSGRLARYISTAADGQLAVSLVLPIVFFRMPQLLELILPLSFLLAIMLSIGELYETNEMAVINATGMSPSRVLAICMGTSVFIALVVALFSFYVSPKGNDYVGNLVNAQGLKNELSSIAPDRFYTLSNEQMTVYAGVIDSERKGLEQVFMFRSQPLVLTADSGTTNKDINSNNEAQPQTIIYAERGFQEYRDDGGFYFVLEHGVQFEGVAGQNEFTLTEFEKYSQRIDEPEDEFNQVTTKAESSYITDLLKRDDLDSIAELHWRLSLPVVVILMAAVGMPLSRSNPRQGRYYLLIPGLILFLLYIVMLNSGKEAISQGEKDPFNAIWLVHIGIAFLATILFFWPAMMSQLRQRSQRKQVLRGEMQL